MVDDYDVINERIRDFVTKQNANTIQVVNIRLQSTNSAMISKLKWQALILESRILSCFSSGSGQFYDGLTVSAGSRSIATASTACVRTLPDRRWTSLVSSRESRNGADGNGTHSKERRPFCDERQSYHNKKRLAMLDDWTDRPHDPDIIADVFRLDRGIKTAQKRRLACRCFQEHLRSLPTSRHI